MFVDYLPALFAVYDDVEQEEGSLRADKFSYPARCCFGADSCYFCSSVSCFFIVEGLTGSCGPFFEPCSELWLCRMAYLYRGGTVPINLPCFLSLSLPRTHPRMLPLGVEGLGWWFGPSFSHFEVGLLWESGPVKWFV